MRTACWKGHERKGDEGEGRRRGHSKREEGERRREAEGTSEGRKRGRRHSKREEGEEGGGAGSLLGGATSHGEEGLHCLPQDATHSSTAIPHLRFPLARTNEGRTQLKEGAEGTPRNGSSRSKEENPQLADKAPAMGEFLTETPILLGLGGRGRNEVSRGGNPHLEDVPHPERVLEDQVRVGALEGKPFEEGRRETPRERVGGGGVLTESARLDPRAPQKKAAQETDDIIREMGAEVVKVGATAEEMGEGVRGPTAKGAERRWTPMGREERGGGRRRRRRG